MINLGLAHLRNRGWLLHLDADIVLPDRLRFILNKSRLDEDCIYGADRVNVVGRGHWEAIKRSANYRRQYRHRYLVARPPRPLAARGCFTTSTAIAPSAISSFGTAGIAIAAITSRKVRRSIPTCSSPCSGRPPGGSCCRACSSITWNPSRPGSAANWGGRVTRPFA